jgi:hypothetical protein
MALDYVEAKQANHPTGYRSTRGLTIAILILLGLHALLSVLTCLGVKSALDAIDAMRSGNLAADGIGFGSALAAFAVGAGDIIQRLLFVACTVCFLCWMYRGYANLPALGSESILSSPKSAVVGWFIPFVNLVHGYRSTHTLYLESQRPAVLPSGYVLPTRAAIVGWWWGTYLARNLVSRIADRMFDHGGEGALTWFWIASALDIAAAILCMVVVYRVDKRQRDQHQDLIQRTLIPVPTGATLR